MANVEKISVAITQEMGATVRAVVATGEYASTSEVVRHALREWSFRRTRRQSAIESIGRLWDEGMASGPASDGEDAFGRIRAGLHVEVDRERGRR